MAGESLLARLTAEGSHMLTKRHGFASERAESADGSTALRQVGELSAS